ncbi:hypothetical protein [Tahibacter harae]|uniref:DUF4034 domain-containing protein n=1 Tax=Tahibacter harae TaxID=2963937 RepID=A0ABT1QZC6_9GAMM|nr:hypothetical protein [Tahibacter harae]MCQ4167637.1 hypothetical protein [Tahibacter harae]
MANANTLRDSVLLVALFAGGAAAGAWLGRSEAPAAAAAAPASAAQTAPAPEPAPPRETSTAAPAAGKAANTPAAALPPRDLPVADYFDQLAAQALQGDAAAARRLADDMAECANSERQFDAVEDILDRAGRGARGAGPDAAQERGPRPRRGREGSDDGLGEAERRLQFAERFLQRAQETERRCAGINAAQIARSGEFIRAAALAGDNAARLCYALAPNEWQRDLLSPEWQDWSQRWKSEAPDMVRRAFEGGLPEAAATLSAMYSPWQPARGTRPWTGQLGDQPYWAYAYAAVARQTLGAEAAPRLAEVMQQHAQRLTPAQVAQADAWAAAARARIRFEAPLPGTRDFWRSSSLCDGVRRAGGRL